MLRNGTFPTVSTAFDKIVHVGHSFGSAQTFALADMYPHLTDGIVLTGFSMDPSYNGYFFAADNVQQAYLNQPLRFGNSSTATTIQQTLQDLGLTDLLSYPNVLPNDALDYPPGYLVNANVGALQYNFLYPGYFDEDIAYYGEQTKQPVTIGESLTLTSLSPMNAYSGPVLVITGSNDLPYCGGDCLNTGGAASSIVAGVQKSFPNTRIEVVIQPNTGHGINFHYNATGAYNVINNFIDGFGSA